MIEFVALIGAVLICVYLYLTWNYDFWHKQGVPYDKPVVLLGSLKDVLTTKKHIAVYQQDLYNKYHQYPYVGFFILRQPALLVRDPELLKTILVKDFDVFIDRNFHPDENVDPLVSGMLFAIRGNRWRHLRVKMTPTFTSGKMKRMFQLVSQCADELSEIFVQNSKMEEIVEVKDLMARYTTDVICSCAFGIQCHSLKDPESKFRAMGRKLFEPSLRLAIAGAGNFFFPALVRFLRVSSIPTSIATFFRSAMKDTIEYRERNNVTRPDFLQLLLDLKNKGKVDEEGDDDEDKEKKNGYSKLSSGSEYFKFDDATILSQALLFFNAGFETSSTAMTFALYELALHPEIQSRAREEILSVIEHKDNKINYEAIMEMKYLDMVVAETLRKYPPLGFLDRICTRDYKIPGTNVVLPKGYPVFIPVAGLHYDPKFYPEPQKFDPERFTEENKRTRPNYTYLPFGEGPRNCIGNRFALMQSKLGLASVLSKCEVHVCKDTPIPLVIATKTVTLSSEGGLYLRVKPIHC